MSDKSFGDHPNRNIVKNPLLSTAVTGLSIEELTHKAVLLPVTPSQGLITRPDQGPQARALAHADHGTATLPSGDALQTITPPNTTPIPNQNIKNTLDNQNLAKHDKNYTTTQSKASTRSEDDFDVNEYIARLQGTRYVSAPLHSHIKEDKNSNLEENLEEINLNESLSPVEVEVQQSITADIAQNFSQLPAVLPHVASAVFSSFSNMLYKKEQTPEVLNTEDQRYEGEQFQRPDVGVPLQVEEYSTPKEVGPPPKEPPVGGASNFRITSKKKYAQIPGLSSRDGQAMPFGVPNPNVPLSGPTQNIPFGGPSQNIPFGGPSQSIPFGGPSQNIPLSGPRQSTPLGGPSQNMSFGLPPTSGQPLPPFVQSLPPIGMAESWGILPTGNTVPFSQNAPPLAQNEPHLVQNKPPFVQKEPPFVQNETVTDQKPQFVQSSIGQKSAFVPSVPSTNVAIFNPTDSKLDVKPEIQNSGVQYNIFNPVEQRVTSETAVASESLSNPPVNKDSNYFTPIEHKENIPAVPGAAIIPPPPMFSNLPRRDSQSAGKSILPPSVARRISANQPVVKAQVPAPPFTENIFVPTIPDVPDSENQSSGYSAFAFVPATSAQITADPLRPTNITPERTHEDKSQASGIPSFFTPTEAVPVVFSEPTVNPMIPPSIPTNTAVPSAPPQFGSTTPMTGPPTNLPPVAFFTPETSKSEFTIPASNLPPPPFFNPMQYTESTEPHPITQLPADPTPEQKKPVPEPPKAVAGNFRMTKKRPQYYAGPIEGVGDISNNVKPVIPSVMPTEVSSFQGALFTPAPVEVADQVAAQTVEPTIPFDISQPVVAPTQSIEYNAPQDYSAFNLRQSHNQSYNQDYNTSFDLSRATTDTYEAPKQEASGFGIIGSLKSKLSAIDINKIQNSVTTFFDPAYNDTKVPGADSLENQPLLQYGQDSAYQQHFGAQDQNLEIFVGNQSTSHNYDQNQYYSQQYQGQNYAPSYYTDQNQAQTDNANTQTYAYTQNIPESNLKPVDSAFYNPNQFGENIQSSTAQPSYGVQDQVSTNVKSHENVTFFNPNAVTQQSAPQEVHNVYQADVQQNVETSKPENKTYSNRNEGLHGHQNHDSPLSDTSYSNINVYSPPSLTENQIPFYNPNAYVSERHEGQKDTPFASIDNQPHTSAGLHKMLNITHGESNMDGTCDSALNTTKYSFSNTPQVQASLTKMPLGMAASFFDSSQTSTTQNPFSTEMIDQNISEGAFTRYQGRTEESKTFEPELVTNPHLAPIGTKSKIETKADDTNKEKLVKEGNPVESLTMENIPVLGVPSLPLFALSSLIADKTKEINEPEVQIFDKPLDGLFGNKSSASFFENITKEENMPKELDISALKITDVKNVLLMEPPQENIVTVLKRNASSSKLEAKAEEVCGHFKQNTPSNDYHQVQQENVIDTQNDSFFNHPAEKEGESHVKHGNLEHKDGEDSELNICETCREVNTPELDETIPREAEELTTQLIENLTSRISLSHPLTATFTEIDAPVKEMPQFDDQLQEITDAAQETIESLHVQTASELLDDRTSEIRNYGWADNAYPSTALGDQYGQFDTDATIKEHNFGFNVDINPPAVPDHDYEFKLDPNTVGFSGSNSLFFEDVPQNASDEIKAEIKNSHDDIVLPRQMSIPSAPPAEDDSKSDETGGLDVLSIEQDAKRDFPLDEEFIIEPSETDDDKMEFRERKRSSEDSNSSDTFTNRIERFKKAADHFGDDPFEQKEAMYSIPPITMASYFDTGNYAVESHYKNCASPVQMPMHPYHRPSFEFVRIPPGFEEQYKNMLKNVEPVPDAPYIPETSTQTKTTITPTFSVPQNIEKKIHSPAFVSKTDTENVNTIPEPGQDFSEPLQHSQDSQINQGVLSLPESLTIPEVLSTQEVLTTHGAKPEEGAQTVQPLQDPINFFTKEDPKPQEETASFNRLASYFSMPAPQPDHSKSFFELSESQNHYRHESKTEEDKSRLDLNPSQNYIDDVAKNNIANLMLDLTSPKNLREQIVTTINHLTVTYNNVTNNAAKPIKIDLANVNNIDLPNKIDLPNANEINLSNTNKNHLNTNEINISNKNKTECDKTNIKTTPNELDSEQILVENDIDSKTVLNCTYCSKYFEFPTTFKVRTAVNETSEAKTSTMSGHDDATKRSVSIHLGTASEGGSNHGVSVLNETRITSDYTPVKHHWFYRVDVEDKSVWRGFSVTDSKALEDALNSPTLDENTLVPTDGGRFDVNVVGRLRVAVYWKEKPTNVRRCSWFYKGTTDPRYVPYTEVVAEKLEEEYRHGILTGEWHRKLVLPNSEMVIMHGPTVMVHFLQSSATDAFTTPPTVLGKKVYRHPLKIKMARDWPPHIDHLILMIHGVGEKRAKEAQATARPRVVRRGHEESEIEDCEPSRIEHLLLLCHGVGSACDLRFRSVEEVVNDFRTTSFQLLQSHYKDAYDSGIVNRIEVLPISWHSGLHSGEGGVDSRLSRVTLDSIPRLRAFTNNTVLDVLFYTSDVFHKMIVDTVCSEMNRVYELFKARNPEFKGAVSLGGHSLGSVILYDLLCNQISEQSIPRKTYVSEAATHPTVEYPQLHFHPSALYALGSPISIFECIRGVDSLGMDFQLPTCKNFFNIFHPFDPIAYRIEPLINSELQRVKPELIPHHKGRKRMHLELKDTMTRVGADLKQKLIESVRNTWNKWTAQPNIDGHLEKVVEEDMEKEQLCDDKDEKPNEMQATSEMLGVLNKGRRIDHVLQEAPLEMINEYLFAMSSHVGYWESEDTMLLILREVYSSLGVQPDCTVPQQCMSVQRNSIDETSIISEKDYPSTSRGRAS